jgi:hypothetical protein
MLAERQLHPRHLAKGETRGMLSRLCSPAAALSCEFPTVIGQMTP